jgi:hypothetical protein
MIITNPEMNKKIVSLLRIDKENHLDLYAARRIEELEFFAQTVRDTLVSSQHNDRTSFSLWNAAYKLVPKENTP